MTSHSAKGQPLTVLVLRHGADRSASAPVRPWAGLPTDDSPGRPLPGSAVRTSRELTRARLASALGQLLELSGPARWSADAGGRPQLVSSDHHLSISHASGLSVAAVHLRPVGVDAEHTTRREAQTQRILARLSASQQRTLHHADSDVRGPHLTAVWTRKEAVLKAAGVGLDAGVADLDVPLDRAPIAGWSISPLGRWFVRDVPFGDHAIAVATAEPVEIVLREITQP